MSAHDILIVDDETDIRRSISGLLKDEGLSPREAAHSDEALTQIAARCPSMVLLDIWLQGSRMDGLELLRHLRQNHPGVPVVMISGHGNIETAVAAIKDGAYDFIEKPFKADRLLLVVSRAIEAAQLRRENEELRFRSGVVSALTGESEPIRRVRQAIEKVAPTGSRVMLAGPAGSGKEVAARALHLQSRRASGPFVVVNCAVLRPDRLEIELFGTEANSHGERRIGTLEQAHNGTLLLDEVADMPLETQGKVVRVLQEQCFVRVGGERRVDVDVRILASSNRDLQAEMTAGRFRQDLYYRLNVVPMVLPPLTQRREDIPTLARELMISAAQSAGLPVRELAADALVALQAYDWPGNVRQMRNVMDWLLVMAGGDPREAVRAEMLPPEVRMATPAVLRWDHGDEIMGLPLRDAREMFEREYLMAQVTRFGGNISRTASFVGMERSALHRKLKTLGVHGGMEKLN
ncbi:MAG: sigma-54-dependent Fis family transcriptional regulator [Alphaproteobacteria bacterium]|nr:MAG: sigma-54-dependent Fis family transcriptional regulator [Alphaproteobacteria bacterium]